MSTSSASNVTISEDSKSEQTEISKASRMTLKEVQNVVSNLKENVLPRKLGSHVALKDLPVSSTKGVEPTKAKRCKMVEFLAKATQTTIEEEHNMTTETPNDTYWMKVAEKRRVALEASLKENAELHMTVADLKDELETAHSLVLQLQSIVDTMNELLIENEDMKASEDKKEDDSGISNSLLLDGRDD